MTTAYPAGGLTQLQDLVALECRASDPHHRKVIDAVCRHSTRYCAARKPERRLERPTRKLSREQRVRNARIAKVAKDELVGSGILGFVVGEVLAWLIGKALDAFWAWYWGEPKSIEYCSAMAAGFPAWQGP